MTTYSFEEAFQASIKYFNGDNLAADVFLNKYALRNEDGELLEKTPDDMHKRIAKEFARIEAKKFKEPMSEAFIYDLIKEFKYIVPQGSPMYGIGNTFREISLSNCFVVDSPKDNYSSIIDTDKQIANISKRRGGVGVNLDNLRPTGSKVNNAARTSTGITSWMERYSNTIREVGQNGRRGALMETISIRHPDSVNLDEGSVDFCSVKQDKTKVTGANVSIKIDDEFMNKVVAKEKYTQRWPINAEKPVITKQIDAEKAWNKIIDCAHNSAEPGILFWDNVLKYGVADIYEKYRSEAVNPCAELTLCSLDSCRLLLLNTFSFVENPFTKDAYFDVKTFYQYSQYAQRLMDDLVDLEAECIERILVKIRKQYNDGDIELRDEIKMWEKILDLNCNGRRTGTGVTAIGDCLAALNIKYGSEESISIVGEIYKCLKLGCYRSSIDMAKELGTFDVWNPELEKGNPFIEQIKDDRIHLWDSCMVDGRFIYDEMMKVGRRNVALLTTAPTGSVSILTQTTGGIEPLFMTGYKRRKKINPNDDNVKVDFVDQNGDSWQEFMVYHEKVRLWMQITGETDITKSPWYGACANDINWVNRVKFQGAAQKHVCHGISSTINLPNDVTKEKVSEIYIQAWKSKLKGITVYRDGCRTGVLVSDKKTEISSQDAVKRPKELDCDIYHYNGMGVVVGLLEGLPYEVFLINDFKPTKQQKSGKISRIKQKHYRLTSEDEVLLDNAEEHCSKEQEAMARLTSLSLRHNVELDYVITQISKVKGDMFDSCRAIAKALKRYLKDGSKIKSESCQSCGGKNIVHLEGCLTCADCGISKCG